MQIILKLYKHEPGGELAATARFEDAPLDPERALYDRLAAMTLLSVWMWTPLYP